jgi:hypothetical protein
MLDLYHDESRPSRVRVAFADGELLFMLSKDATFQDLAGRLCDLDERHHGKPVAIEVKPPLRQMPSDAASSRGLVAVSAPPHQRRHLIRAGAVRYPQSENQKRKYHIQI